MLVLVPVLVLVPMIMAVMQIRYVRVLVHSPRVAMAMRVLGAFGR